MSHHASRAQWRLSLQGKALVSAPPALRVAALLELPDDTIAVLRAYEAEPAAYLELLRRLQVDVRKDIGKASAVLGTALKLDDANLIEKVPT